MKIVQHNNVYSFILNEDEWYSGTEQQREAWRVECQRKCDEAACKYAVILVEPDSVMSISPIPVRHKVWNWTAPDTQGEKFNDALLDLCEKYEGKLTLLEMRTIAKRVFG